MASGACDGEIRLWDLALRKTIWNVHAHKGFVRGICCSFDGNHLISCGDDKTIKIWSREQEMISKCDHSGLLKQEKLDISRNGRSGVKNNAIANGVAPVATILGDHAFLAVDANYENNMFAVAGVGVGLYDSSRTSLIHEFSWGADTNHVIKFNPVETNILVSSASDRNIVFYDVRTKSPLRKLIMQMNTNSLSWNPMEAYIFSFANEDHNCYTFDMRKLSSALNVYLDHVSAVMSIDYSPTGREFVTGGYDHTIRIYPVNECHSREVYYTERMQRIFDVKYSADNKYVLSGSDDANIRLWKAQASAPLKNLVRKEKTKLDYSNRLKERFKFAPEIRRIQRHRHVPLNIKNAISQKIISRTAQKNKLERVIAHSAAGTVDVPSERKMHIVETVK